MGTFTLITDYFIFLKNSGEVKRNIEAKMPSKFLGKKNCPCLPFAASFITNRIFFYNQYIQKCIQKCIHNVYTMYTRCICAYLLIFEFDFFSLSLFPADFL